MAQKIADNFPLLKQNSAVDFPSDMTIGGSTVAALGVITSTSANALTAGRQGTTSPAFNVDASTSSQAAGLNVIGAASGAGVSLISIGGTNELMTIDGKGTGTVGINTLGATSGLVTIGNTSSKAGLAVNGLLTTSVASSTINAALSTHTPTAVNSTATLTAAQVQTGYITSTSAAAVTMTLPTGTLLGTQLSATQGMIHDLFIDNTAGANTVTIAVAVNGILSAAAAANGASQGLLTVPSGITGQACFRLMFSSASAYTFTRIA